MSLADDVKAPIRHADRFFIGGQWVRDRRGRRGGRPAAGRAQRRHRGPLRSGTVGHNAFRTDFSVSFGGFKQSGIGREGIHEGLPHFLETKFVILEAAPPARGHRSVSP
jgi:Aldehyde dehydrogenase family